MLKIILFILLTVPWGVIRHGIDKSKSLALAAQPEFACVGMFTQYRRIKGSCVLIHPRMALTAAHTLDKTHDRSPLYVEFGSTEILIDSFSIHPLYRQNPHFFKRVVGQFASVSFHADLEKTQRNKLSTLSAKLLTYE